MWARASRPARRAFKKMFMVFVDVRCRGDAKNPECVRGGPYSTSVRALGGRAKSDKYFLYHMKHIDGTYTHDGRDAERGHR